MKRKQARCMADGGVIRETPEQMLARMNAKYGLGDAGKSPAPQPQPAPTKQPAASPQPSQPSGLMGKATDAIGRRNEELKKAAGYAEGGIIPVDIGRGLVQAIAQPLAEDWRQGNKAIKALRDQYPTVDTFAGIHPGVAAAQVANDVMSGDVGADTAGNVAQMIPILRRANILTKGSVAIPGMGRFAVNMPATVRKNTAITAAQTLGQPANAFARGGIMPVVGSGTGTSDSVPVVVAGQDVRLSNGEGAAILPARTMRNPAAVQAVEGIIEATNGKPPVRGARGLAYGGILGQQNQTGISGVWRTGNSFTQTDSGPSIGTPAIAAATSPATQPVSAQPVPAQTPTTNIIRNGNSFSAAPPSLSSQALTSPAGQPAPAPLVGQATPVQPTVPPSPTPATPTTDAYGNSLAQTQRYQKQLDELQKGPENQVMRLAAGGVIDPEEEKRRKAQAPTAQEVYGPAYRGISGALSGGTATTPTSAPTAQEVYRGVSMQGIADAVTPKNNLASHPIYSGVSAQGMIDAVMPGSGQAPAPGVQSAPQTPVVSPDTNALRRPTAISAPAQQVQAAPPEVRSLWAGEDTRDERTGLELERARVAAGRGLADEIRNFIRYFNGPSLLTSALVGDGRATASSPPSRGAQQSAARRIDQASVPLPVQNGATTTSDAGNARFNPESGILSFTQPGFDPTKQQFAPGAGAISNAAGKTLLLAPSWIAGAAQPPGAVDAYGNSTARTDQMKAELAQLQANGGQSEGPRVSMLQSLPAEQADRDRFAQFVRQADADRLAHDLATGGGNARSNAGRIAALNAMRGGIADELGRRAQVEAAGIQGANQMAVERQRGLSQLANTRLAGQTQMAVEDLRQSGPEKALRATKIQGEIEDEKAARAARNGLLSAINSGDPGKISKAWRMGIAAGVVKPEQQEKATPYKFHTDAEGRSVRINEATGATDVLDRADGTYKPVRTSDSPYPDGTRLEGADKKTYVVRNGVPVLEGKK